MVMLLPGTQANNKKKTTLNHAKKDIFHRLSRKRKELSFKKNPLEFPISSVRSTLKKKKLRFDDDFGAKKCSCFEEDRPCPVHSLDEDTLGIDQL